jgi:ABC-type polysaccharide/polyol phosphate transport system ATPase subunit
MYIRLAFAAAIAVQPQILIIDEALAVGDAVFQHRCMRRIKEMVASDLAALTKEDFSRKDAKAQRHA